MNAPGDPTAAPAGYDWRRQISDRDFRPVAVAAIPFDTALPASEYPATLDRQLLEEHFGQPVAYLSEWHFYGRRFRLLDGTDGVLAATR